MVGRIVMEDRHRMEEILHRTEAEEGIIEEVRPRTIALTAVGMVIVTEMMMAGSQRHQ